MQLIRQDLVYKLWTMLIGGDEPPLPEFQWKWHGNFCLVCEKATAVVWLGARPILTIDTLNFNQVLILSWPFFSRRRFWAVTKHRLDFQGEWTCWTAEDITCIKERKALDFPLQPQTTEDANKMNRNKSVSVKTSFALAAGEVQEYYLALNPRLVERLLVTWEFYLMTTCSSKRWLTVLTHILFFWTRPQLWPCWFKTLFIVAGSS